MTPTIYQAIGEIAIAATALERGIDSCLSSCLQGLPSRQNIAVLSRLTFRQRLDILHELALEILGEEEHEGFNHWRKRVAKAWARSTRSLSRTRLAHEEFDADAARRIARHLEAESATAMEWAKALASPG
jgi:hypothetical protein